MDEIERYGEELASTWPGRHLYISPGDGSMVKGDFERLQEVVRKLDPDMRLEWLPPFM
jgi:hypothetical protein